MKNHKRVIYNRLNWRTAVISLAIFWCAVTGYYSNQDNTYVADAPEVSVFMTATVVESEPTIEDKIKVYFPRSWKTMIAIAHAESGMNMNAKGYNCFYNKDETVVYETRVKGAHSGACKKEHRVYAHSVDCFALQKNYKGKECPTSVTVDEHLKEVAELSKVQGLSAWAAFNNGSYKKYLATK